MEECTFWGLVNMSYSWVIAQEPTDFEAKNRLFQLKRSQRTSTHQIVLLQRLKAQNVLSGETHNKQTYFSG